jgi:hypothetical protein
MADRKVDSDLSVTGTVNATVLQEGGIPAVTSSDVDDAVEISQSAYDALGAGRPAGRLYLITS